jgi:hypothetical protein
MVDVVIVVQPDADLLEIVRALDAPGCLTRRLNGGRSKAIKTAMMAITTSNSIRVKP